MNIILTKSIYKVFQLNYIIFYYKTFFHVKLHKNDNKIIIKFVVLTILFLIAVHINNIDAIIVLIIK